MGITVVPLVGTWIEIWDVAEQKRAYEVVPLVGTWIEINYTPVAMESPEVVPLVGTWIEIVLTLSADRLFSRAPRGHTD